MKMGNVQYPSAFSKTTILHYGAPNPQVWSSGYGSRLWSPVYHTKQLVVVDDRAVNTMSPAFFDIKFDNSLHKIHVVLAGPVLSMILDDTI